MAMAVSVGCSLRCCSSIGSCCPPLLYLSLFFSDRGEYYRLLGEVRRTGDWEAWMGFFLEGVETTADEAVIAAREVFALSPRIDRAYWSREAPRLWPYD